MLENKMKFIKSFSIIIIVFIFIINPSYSCLDNIESIASVSKTSIIPRSMKKAVSYYILASVGLWSMTSGVFIYRMREIEKEVSENDFSVDSDTYDLALDNLKEADDIEIQKLQDNLKTLLLDPSVSEGEKELLSFLKDELHLYQAKNNIK